MDPLSISAGIAGLVSTADVVVTRLYKYIKGVKEADKDISALAVEVTGLYGVLNSLHLVALRFEDERFDPMMQIHHLHACYDTLDSLRSLLIKHDPAMAASKREAAMKCFQWPLSARRTKDFIEEVGRHKQTLSLATSAQTLDALLESLTRQQGLIKGVEEIRNQMEMMSLTKARRHVLDWFSQIDAKRAHASILGLRQMDTGMWICDNAIFKDWMAGISAKSDNTHGNMSCEDLGLWIVGIPGAGKTVLTATIIQEVTKRRPSVGTAVAFFFCDYKDPAANTPGMILGSLVRQVACQNIHCYETAQSLYDEYDQADGLTPPASSENLRRCLAQMGRHLDHLYIIIDGLDECGDERVSTIQMLRDLGPLDSEHAIHLLFVSRDDFDIRIALDDYTLLSIAANSHDLRLYVDAEIASRTAKRKLRIRDPALKEEIREELVSKADGMFRWVVCQIDAICALSTDKSRRNALRMLPPDLPTTYERILEKVNSSSEENQIIVWRALRWILFSVRPLPLAALSEAVSVNPGDTSLERDAIVDEEAILEGCGSLIRRKADTLELAHFTVREFLLAISETKHSRYIRYRADASKDGMYLAETCLTHMCFEEFVVDGPSRTREQFVANKSSHPFRRYTVRYWDIHARAYEDTICIMHLLQKLFDPSSRLHLFAFVNDFACVMENEGLIHDSLDLSYDTADLDGKPGRPPLVKILFVGSRPEQSMLSRLVDVSPLHWAARLALPSLCRWLIERENNVNEVNHIMSSPLDCAVAGRRLSGYHLTKSHHGKAELAQCRMRTVKVIVAAGGNLNHRHWLDFKDDRPPELILFHAMYAAEEGQNWEVVRFLLAAGSLCDRACLGYFRSIQKQDFQGWEIFRGLTEDQILKDDLGYFRELLANLDMGWERLDDPTRAQVSSLESKMLLFNAAMYGRLEAVRKLALTAERLNAIDEKGGTALHIAVQHDHPATVEYLCTAGIKINYADSSGMTALMVAAMNEKVQCASILLQHGADVRAVEEHGLSALHYASSLQSITLIEMILLSPKSGGSSLYRNDERGETPLLRAAALGSLEVVKHIIERFEEADIRGRRDDGEGCLHQAAWSGDAKKIEFFLSNGLNINDNNYSGGSPLFNATHHRPQKHMLDTIKMLHSYGAEIDAVDSSGSVPLFRMIDEFGELGSRDMLDAFSYLLHRTVNINRVNDEGHNALHMVCAICPEATSSCIQIICRALIRRGCSLKAQSKYGLSPIHILVNYYLAFDENESQTFEFETRDEDDVEEPEFEDCNPFGGLIRCILKYTPIEENVLDGVYCDGISLLSTSIRSHDDGLIQAILAHDNEVDRRDDRRAPGHLEPMTPLEWACVSSLLSKSSVQSIISHSHALDVAGYQGAFPLHLATMQADVWPAYMVEELLESGADPNRESADYRTPLMIACSQGRNHLMELLYEKGARIISNDHHNGLAAVCANGHTEVLKWLFSKPDIEVDLNSTFRYTDKANLVDMTLLHQAAIEGKTDMIAMLLDKGIVHSVKSTVTARGSSTAGLTPLYMATVEGHLDTVCLLLERGADPSMPGGPKGKLPLHVAAEQGFVDIFRTMLTSGAALYVDGDSCSTSILLDLEAGNSEIAEMIREALEKQGMPRIASPLVIDKEISER